MNYGLASEEYPRCSKRETWCHLVQYSETLEMKVELITKLKEKLIKERHKEITKEEIEVMIRDIRRYLANRQEGYETNQQYLGMKVMF